MTEAWNKAYEKRRLHDLCSKQITIDIYGDRCIYINDHRVQGGKPYHSENLPIKSKDTTVRDVLEAFSVEEIQAFLAEKIAVDSYCAGLRNYRDAEKLLKSKGGSEDDK